MRVQEVEGESIGGADPPAIHSVAWPSEGVGQASGQSRARRIWNEWLEALARDPEAALAAALAYREMDVSSRDEWLDALEVDSDHLGVPKLAVYAPLLAVEQDGARRLRIAHAVESSGDSTFVNPSKLTTLAAYGRDGRHLAVLIRPLYLDFVQVLACAYMPGRHFHWVRHDPIARQGTTLRAGAFLDGEELDAVPAKVLVDELALTVVSHVRLGGELPEALCLFADLFGPCPIVFGASGSETTSEAP